MENRLWVGKKLQYEANNCEASGAGRRNDAGELGLEERQWKQKWAYLTTT